MTRRSVSLERLGRGIASLASCSSHNSRSSNSQPVDPDWQVGGWYKVSAKDVSLWSSPNGEAERIGLLQSCDEVLLVGLHGTGEFAGKSGAPVGEPKGLVVPWSSTSVSPGWMVLEGPLIRRRLEGSWELKARYTVQSPATLRSGKGLTSDWVGEVDPGDEVTVLELGFNEERELGFNKEQKPRLRMRVCSVNGKVGWLSPLTASGHQLLCPLNLLSEKVVDVHRQRSSSNSIQLLREVGAHVAVSAGPRGSVTSMAGGRRTSFQPGASVPWEVGGQYRILERLSLHEEARLCSKLLGKPRAGQLVEVSEVQLVDQPRGLCPCAMIRVIEGVDMGKQGWVLCTSKDGHDQVDTRNQLEATRVCARLKQEEMECRKNPKDHADVATTAHTRRQQVTNKCQVAGQSSWKRLHCLSGVLRPCYRGFVPGKSTKAARRDGQDIPLLLD